jgi:uncharacterized Zn finger protein (UPF0148 family)
MSYENAPGTKMLDTFCGICGRPLLACKSVEVAIGPDCRKKVYSVDIDSTVSAATVKAADKLINEAGKLYASNDTDATAARQIEIARELCNLGFANVAKKISTRWTKRAAKASEKKIKAAKIRLELVVNHEPGEPAAPMSYSVKTPYNPDFVAELKTLPWKSRKWNRDAKRWEVCCTEARALWNAIKSHYPGLSGHGPKGFFTVPA